ncbi:MAG: hypothetical protein JNM93_07560 [Bacteriovoracaceae bacterium]|nr:hypothetical protein [Bacteriovoracaceae bacterium]
MKFLIGLLFAMSLNVFAQGETKLNFDKLGSIEVDKEVYVVHKGVGGKFHIERKKLKDVYFDEKVITFEEMGVVDFNKEIATP